ncbi:hypothetical protein CFP65_0868 [Kitasatospora sp. MMS16-BH015]|uniref:DUF4097 family beta strand repeat-containing protein n=1 Tax=Kitasatospora sp. MMS16-BH015 TaxID=2018025 RepID=UPI000CA22C04|nr:DUF4097 family beta strand repeat-containing protein [Kitasatospora sp. MMS16-BH015]AUG75794.1 hypothetical protein CFP65_0868 [Kitasatospora sp. MMS16-BH015]
MSRSTFSTSSPIVVLLDLYVADVRIRATDGADTVVEVSPTDPAKPSDVKAAEATRVEYDEVTRTLTVVTRKPRNRFVNFSKRPESIDVVLTLPSDSDVRGEVELGDYLAEGVLGSVQLKSGLGAVRLGETGDLTVRTSIGEVSVDGVSGSAQVHSSAGEVRIGVVDGGADVSSGNGTVRIGVVTGTAKVKVSNGAVSVDRALSDITATNSNGEVRIGEVVRGKVVAASKNGRVDVGVRDGSAAWLELDTKVGRVYNDLAAAEAPEAGEPVDKVEVHAETKLGDIVIRRTARLEEQA